MNTKRGARRSGTSFLGLVAAAFLAAPAIAQNQGELAGTVYDKAKGVSAPIANAIVSIGRDYVRTDAQGKYRIARTWTLRGYATTCAPGYDAAFSVYRVDRGQTTTLDIALTPRAEQVQLAVTETQREGKPIDVSLRDEPGAIALLFFNTQVAIPPLELDKEGIQGVLWTSWIRMQSLVLGVVPASGTLDMQFVAPPAGAKIYMQVFSFRSMLDMRLSNGVVTETSK